jgi:hypothetical protein
MIQRLRLERLALPGGLDLDRSSSAGVSCRLVGAARGAADGSGGTLAQARRPQALRAELALPAAPRLDDAGRRSGADLLLGRPGQAGELEEGELMLLRSARTGFRSAPCCARPGARAP